MKSPKEQNVVETFKSMKTWSESPDTLERMLSKSTNIKLALKSRFSVINPKSIKLDSELLSPEGN